MMTSGESVGNVQTKEAKKNIVSFLSLYIHSLFALHTTEILYFVFYECIYGREEKTENFSFIFSSFLLANANVMMMMMKWMTFHENRVSVDTFCRLSSFLSYLL